MNLKKTLPSLLKKKGWTYEKLSKVTGIPRSTLHSWTTQNAVSLDQLKSVATALEVGVHTLVYGIPDPFEEISEDVLHDLFKGDVRVTIQRIERRKK